jgi:peptidoglycan/xylan/chitin deacetylase (PgdA/CDA1 family)
VNASIIIPAHNAAGTIAQTLESVIGQTAPNWEAIVINDGSADETADIVAQCAGKDSRIRLINQPQSGVSVARNKGIELAHAEWLLFLDADDWVAPHYLERLAGALVKKPAAGILCCGWTYVAPDGRYNQEPRFLPSNDPFDLFSRYCAVAIHSCLVRRSLVKEMGGFDPTLHTCEDWDLWQRLARTGTQFEAVNEVLAFYRMRVGSAAVNATRVLADGLRVIARGHAPDPRVPNAHPAYQNGLPPERLSGERLRFSGWVAGLLIGSGSSAENVLDSLKADHDPSLNAHDVAYTLFRSVPLPACRTVSEWPDFWPQVSGQIGQFLQALEAQSQAQGVAGSAMLTLERLILENTTFPLPLTIGSTHATQFEVTQPLTDVVLPAPCQRLKGIITLEGERVRALELPVIDGRVSSYVLADAIAAEFGWQLMGQFFNRTIYPTLRSEKDQTGLSFYRGEVRLAGGLAEDEVSAWTHLHDQVGWTIFLQEIWERPTWPLSSFYDVHTPDETAAEILDIIDGTLTVEVSQSLPTVRTTGTELKVVVQVGGAAIGVVCIPATGGIITPQTLRAMAAGATGMDLCRAAVREGLLGRSFSGPASLHQRLADSAARHAGVADFFTTKPDDGTSVVLGRRDTNLFETSASRRAVLPVAAWQEILEAAAVTGNPVVQSSQDGVTPAQIIYQPELIDPHNPAPRPKIGQVFASQTPPPAHLYDRSHFEALFAHQPDPWKYTSPYEQTKYEQTLGLLPPGKIKNALEVACAEGHFTKQLALRVDHLLATDFSQIALDHAAERCAGLDNVQFLPLDLKKDSIPGKFDLIVCSEVLYYVDGIKGLKTVAKKFSGALQISGYLVMAHANLIVDEPDRPGFDWGLPFGARVIGDVFKNSPHLEMVKELYTPLYRIQLFQKKTFIRRPFQRRSPEVIEFTRQPTAVPPAVVDTVRWQGGMAGQTAGHREILTYQLPILMYHRVAPNGAGALARYRVHPTAFEEQLRYLRDAGYYSINLEQWRLAMAARQPLPGRAVLITFDDGYADFLDYAWPLLKRYGFSALVFLVAGEVGHFNCWDQPFGEKIPLLDWPQIHQLQQEGVQFGSHSVSHPKLTTLTAPEIVREGARSQAILQRQLGQPVNAFAYPHGDYDQVVQHLIGACGYTFGLTCRDGAGKLADNLLALPRLEIAGTSTFQEFVQKING